MSAGSDRAPASGEAAPASRLYGELADGFHLHERGLFPRAIWVERARASGFEPSWGPGLEEPEGEILVAKRPT